MLHHLDGPDRESFIREVTSQCAQIKKWNGGGGAKQIMAIDRLIAQATQARSVNSPVRPTVTTTTPSSPGVQGDTASTAPTPSLTTEQSSPQSSGPPSMDADNVEDSLAEKAKPSIHNQSSPVARVNEE